MSVVNERRKKRTPGAARVVVVAVGPSLLFAVGRVLVVHECMKEFPS